MPVQTLFPSTTVAAEFSGMGVVGAGTAHEALSDASDLTYATLAVGEFEPHKWWRGELPNLPDGAGVVTGVLVNVRARKLDPLGSEAARLASGDYPNQRVQNQLPDGEVIIDAVSANITDLDVAEVNAAMWMAGALWNGEPGTQVVNVHIFRMFFDVDFNYISGVSVAMIFQYLGPIFGVLLRELPLLRRELWRVARLRLSDAELAQVHRDLRAYRHPRSVVLALP